jgi:hypothetical protein
VNIQTSFARALAVALAVALTLVAIPKAQSAPHLVDQAEVAAILVEQARTRQERIALFQQALATPAVQQEAKSMGLDAAKLSRAIPHLSDTELAELAARATNTKDLAAGHRHHYGEPQTALVIVGVVLLLAALLILAAVSDESDGWDDDCCW